MSGEVTKPTSLSPLHMSQAVPHACSGSPLHSKLIASSKPTPARGVPYRISLTTSLPYSAALKQVSRPLVLKVWHQQHRHYLVRNAGSQAPPQNC